MRYYFVFFHLVIFIWMWCEILLTPEGDTVRVSGYLCFRAHVMCWTAKSFREGIYLRREHQPKHRETDLGSGQCHTEDAF